MLAYTYPLADLFGTMLGLFVFFIWFWLLIMIFGDIFRSRDMGGGAKARSSASSSTWSPVAARCTNAPRPRPSSNSRRSTHT